MPLDSTRWRALRDFVERWYELPIRDGDGHSPLEIELAATRLGTALPAALVEWYALVGRRLGPIQDSPRRLDELAVVDGAISVWIENQGVWNIVAPLDAGDDPICRLDEAGSFASPDAPLSRTLLGMLVSDTLVAAWTGRHVGPLGELGATVRGGYCETFTDDRVTELRAAYGPLPHPPNPFFPEPCRGDDATVIRIEDVAISWMTATDAAFAALDAVLHLQPPDGEHEVVVAFEDLPDVQRRRIARDHGVPDTDLLRSALDGLGHVGMAVGGSSPRLHIRTRDPHRVRDRVLAALPADLRPHVVIATRPIAIALFDVLYPEGRAQYVIR